MTSAKFRRQVLPGELLRLEVDNVKVSKRLVKQCGRVLVGGELAVEAEWICVPARKEDVAPRTGQTV